MTDQTIQSSARLRREAREATMAATELAARRSTIDEEIAEEKQRISRARVHAARRGESPAAASDVDTLGRLVAEKADLPERHYAARLEAAELHIAAEAAIVRELQPKLEKARADLEPLEDALREARARAEAQRGLVNELEGRASGAARRQRQHEMLLEKIEAEGVKPCG